MAGKEDVYCTLVMNDAYLPGAAVLAHSLRDAGSKKKLACLIVPGGLQDSTIQELRTLYNHVIPVERIGNPNPANLYLMNRPDLLYTFTKINLWSQTQFRKIVYLDSDIVALRAPEELFDIEDGFAAAPDVGWPDAFNTGVMVLSPHMGEYQALRGLAGAGDSFDGADQGLLNQYFEHRPWKRLSFTYNTTPSANYQYEPAYRYFKRDISLVHFIGGEKPWQRGRTAQGTPGAFQEMLSRWWAVYDRHFHISANDYIRGQRTVSRYVAEGTNEPHQQVRESYSATGYPIQTTGPAPPPFDSSISETEIQQQQHGHGTRLPGTATPLMTEPGELAENIDQGYVGPASTLEQRRFQAPQMEWDATRGAPPIESRPEAANFPTQTYAFNTDPKPFRPRQSYPQPPRDLWYGVPQKAKEADKPKPIFPWEERQDSRPTRRFVEDEPPPPRLPALSRSLEPYADELEVSSDSKASPVTPIIQVNDRDTRTAFAANKNAWDDDAGIENYVRALTSFQKNRGQVQVVQQNVPTSGTVSSDAQQHIMSPTHEADPVELVERVRQRRESLILTDFPSAVERPSLPVTPAPRRRPTFWGEERDEEGDLPAAEGVPNQVDWDPNAQLEALRRNSLLGPGDLKLPEKKLSKREMPSSAATIPEHALSQHHVPIADRDGAGDDPEAKLSGIASPHGSDGRKDTAVNTAINSSSTSVSAADKPVFSQPGFGSAPTVPASTVAADELDIKRGEQVHSPTQKATESDKTS